MKLTVFFLMALSLNTMLVAAQNASQQDQHNDLEHKRVAITGCLTKNSLKEFELVDERGIDYLPYSATVNLDQYVGEMVTLVGRPSATHSVDSGAPAKPHFMVNQVQSTSGQCKK